MTLEELQQRLAKWNEKTSTSPSGLHLGHWKSLITPLTPDKTTHDYNSIQLLILQAHVDLINYAIKWNYVYERWRKIVTCMIFKEKNNIKIHRLRVIHLYEADFNALIGIKWRALTYKLFDAGILDDGLYGAVPTKRYQDPVLITELQQEISRLSRRAYAKGEADAQACYDCILPLLTSLTSHRYGLPQTVCILHANTLETAKYHLKHLFKVSDAHY